MSAGLKYVNHADPEEADIHYWKKKTIVLKEFVRMMIGEGTSTMSDIEEIIKLRIKVQSLMHTATTAKAHQEVYKREELQLRVTKLREEADK